MTHTKTNTLDALERIAQEQQAQSPIARAIARHPEIADYSEADEVADAQKNLANQHTGPFRLEVDYMGGKTITHKPTGRTLYLQPGEDAAALPDEPTADQLAEYLPSMGEPKTPGQLAYEADCEERPRYHDNTPRPSWPALDDVTRQSWELKPQPRTHGTLTHPFTPGPWEVYAPRHNGHPFEVRQAGGEFVASIYDRSGKRMEDREANARLIAAAPALYDMLRQAWWFMYLQGEADCVAAKEWRATLDQIRGA